MSDNAYIENGIAEAVRLRESGDLEAARRLLLALLERGNHDHPLVNYQLAWTLDRMGVETDAASYYECAIATGLAGDDLRGALLGLGSTYRVIGRDADAVRTLAAGVARFSDDGAMRTFYALALYSAGEYAQATQEFLRVILASSADPQIGQYRNALIEYMEHVDEIWCDGAWYGRS
ncbi:MAG: tetratricopeptide repeat protein [Chloroflexota bacterium]|nr:tetratricopeptide repeat protein [Chloroflexota bacterium]